ncbi:MAG: pyrroline-5-carboxylate reductase [Pseudomonadota bacterium]
MAADSLRGAGAAPLVLLGCGKMGGALLRGWLASGLNPADVQVIEPNPDPWVEQSGVHLNPEDLAPARFAILAVKPQVIRDAASILIPLAQSRTVFLSIAAGTSIATFEDLFGIETAIIRAMPNTPASIGQGISVIVGNDAASEVHLTAAETLMAAVGATVRLGDEAQMDAVTGLSGSGPAYVFHLIEAMAAAGEAEGLSPDLAMTLARRTVTGAGALAGTSEDDVAQLRVNVTSPGGTTAAGLNVLMGELTDLMTRTVAAAAGRSRELG